MAARAVAGLGGGGQGLGCGGLWLGVPLAFPRPLIKAVRPLGPADLSLAE
jgi:hypothetical protein